MKTLMTIAVLMTSMVLFGCGSSDDGSAGSGGSGGTAGSGGMGGDGGMGGTTVIDPTPIIGVLTPYPDDVDGQDGSDLFPSGSVEAHWYQWDGVYVVLYRGYDATNMSGICPGNSIEAEGGFADISNSPYPSTAEAACEGALNIATVGSMSCGGLLYYVTDIPTTTSGNLWGTIELQTGMGFIGQTTFGTPANPASAPDFEPGLPGYDLPETNVDSLDVVTCP